MRYKEISIGSIENMRGIETIGIEMKEEVEEVVLEY